MPRETRSSGTGLSCCLRGALKIVKNCPFCQWCCIRVQMTPVKHMAVRGPSSQLMVKPFWIKVSCIWSHSLTWHFGFCFTGNRKTGVRHAGGRTHTQTSKRHFPGIKSANLCELFASCSASLCNLYSLASSCFLNSCHFQQKCYLVKQQRQRKKMQGKEGGKRLFKVVMFDLEKMPTNPL